MQHYPACFGSLRFYHLWLDSEYHDKRPYCADCLPSYQLRMKREGRCEHPEIKFHRADDGFVIAASHKVIPIVMLPAEAPVKSPRIATPVLGLRPSAIIGGNAGPMRR